MKCDSAPEICQRCARDGFDCPGYEKKTRWKIVTQGEMQLSKRRKGPSSRQDSTSESSSITMTDSSASSSPKRRKNRGSEFEMPTSLILSTIEKEIIEVQYSIIYYNDTLVPDLAASPIPGETISIPLDEWLDKSPKVLHHIIVTIVTCHRLACNGSAHGIPGNTDDSEMADTLNRHRGRGFTQLQRTLSDFWHGGESTTIVTDEQRKAKTTITLVAVVMLLTQEVQMSATSLWSMHLEAARSLVDLLGGVERFWSTSPKLQGLFTLFIMIDVMSPPTSPAWSINETQQRNYLASISRMEDFERRIIASFQPCPLSVLQAIVQTNVLRAMIFRIGSHDIENYLDSNTGQTLTQTAAMTLASLLRFDPSAWSHKVCTGYLELSQPRPHDDADQAAWAGLATAYQSAAIIYLLRSTQHKPLARAAGPTDNVEGMLHEQRTRLSAALSFLCRDLSRSKASALWRFVSWPLFISAYELIAWDQVVRSDGTPPSSGDGVAGTDQQQQQLSPPTPKNITAMLRRLQKVARRLGANSMFDAVELLEKVWRRRSSSVQAGNSSGLDGDQIQSQWKWDDGFQGRCVFVV